jgi:hypothetical protein
MELRLLTRARWLRTGGTAQRRSEELPNAKRHSRLHAPSLDAGLLLRLASARMQKPLNHDRVGDKEQQRVEVVGRRPRSDPPKRSRPIEALRSAYDGREQERATSQPPLRSLAAPAGAEASAAAREERHERQDSDREQHGVDDHTAGDRDDEKHNANDQQHGKGLPGRSNSQP